MNTFKCISQLKSSVFHLNSIKNINKSKLYLNQVSCSATSATNNNNAFKTTTDSAAKSTSDLFFNSDDKKNEKAEKISRAMSYYLEKLNERESVMNFQVQEYNIGKRHLARMMGEYPGSFTQEYVDEAIKYLLPSSLFQKDARPFLKHPENYLPKKHLPSFDNEGRPLSPFFYTINTNFYQVVYQITQKIIELNKLEDAMALVQTKMKIANRENDELKTEKIDTAGSVWLSHDELCKKLDCKIDEFNYNKFIVLFNKLLNHPLSKREEEFISDFRVPFKPPIQLNEIRKAEVNEHGKKMRIVNATQRTAHVTVILTEGTGEIIIKSPTEGTFNINYFASMTHREQILFPFKVVDRINKFDMYILVNKGGMSCLAKAIRTATSKALCSFVSTDYIEKLRLAGLLTLDRRIKEKKKPGREGARRRYTWKAR